LNSHNAISFLVDTESTGAAFGLETNVFESTLHLVISGAVFGLAVHHLKVDDFAIAVLNHSELLAALLVDTPLERVRADGIHVVHVFGIVSAGCNCSRLWLRSSIAAFFNNLLPVVCLAWAWRGRCLQAPIGMVGA